MDEGGNHSFLITKEKGGGKRLVRGGFSLKCVQYGRGFDPLKESSECLVSAQ